MRHKLFLFVLALFLCSGLVWADAYDKTLRQWSRSQKEFRWENIELHLEWTATYLGPEFRQARLENEKKRLHLLPEETAEREARDQAEMGKEDVFFASIYCGSSKWKDVGKNIHEWRFLLEVEGQSPVKAIAVEQLKTTTRMRDDFPYINRWSKTYRIRFPKTITDEKAPFRLIMAGIPENSTLHWR